MYKHFIQQKILCPHMGILLFNDYGASSATGYKGFSSPLWGFFYLIMTDKQFDKIMKSSRPLSGDSFI